MCGWSILSLESCQGKILKKNAVRKSPFLRTKALQECQTQIIVIL